MTEMIHFGCYKVARLHINDLLFDTIQLYSKMNRDTKEPLVGAQGHKNQSTAYTGSDLSSSISQSRHGRLADTSWRTGFWRRFPPTGMLSILTAILASTCMIYIVSTSDGKPINNWKYQPTVYLSITYTIANLALQYALAQAITMAWWIKALKGDASVRDLHNVWAFGSSFVDILASPRSFNIVALAGLAVALVPINGPLLQRSSVVIERTRVELKNLTIPTALEFPDGYTGDIASMMGSHYPTAISSSFSEILKQHNNRQSINITDVGCEGICTGTLLGAGYDIHCWNESIRATNLDNRTREDAGWGWRTTPFSSGFSYEEVEDPVINFTVTFKSEPVLDANYTTSKCILRPATVEYPILLTNNTITLDATGSWKSDRISKLRPAMFNSGLVNSPTTHGGMWLYLDALYNSSMYADYSGRLGWRGSYSGAAAYRYVNNVGLMGVKSSLDEGATLSFLDPTQDAMDTVREIAWRTALYIPQDNIKTQDIHSRLKNLTNTEWADAYSQRIEVRQSTKQIVYRSQYAYLGVAVAMTLCASFCVLALSLGWWKLGREVSLSPIEIAKAFAAPLLQGTNSNHSAKAILKDLGEDKLCYGTGWEDGGGVPAATLRFDRPGRSEKPLNAQVIG
jgi:hypothetical protein